MFTIEGDIVVPQGYQGETFFIVPDEIVITCINRFGLCYPGVRVLDPMCGVGTFPRVINTQGGICDGVEIDNERYEASVRFVGNLHIFKGDFRSVSLPALHYDCIFTSIPFAWFNNSQATEALDTSYTKRFRELLIPNGFVLLDSIPMLQQYGNDWPVAQLQAEYLIHNGFKLDEVIAFDNKKLTDLSARSVIMKFS